MADEGTGQLDGLRVLITGASRGIGYAIADACLREGATVGVNYLASEERARELQEKHPKRAHLVPFDVRDYQQVACGVRRFVQLAGHVDGLVNNAGVFANGFLVRANMAECRVLLDTNLLGVIHCTNAVLPAMVKQKRGVIVCMSSIAAVHPSPGQAVYAATKGGIEAFTRVVAAEYVTRGIRVNCVRPGPTDTDMLRQLDQDTRRQLLGRIQQGRFIQPSDIADLLVLLLGRTGERLTGMTLTIDGGCSLG